MPKNITVIEIDLDKLTPEKKERLISFLKEQFAEDFPEDKEEETQTRW